ncbi:MAG: hypothetical protein QXY20_07175 [Thermofilum sp.]|uniref:hypothetical protein n=1 Tax=Thermofilum sp. TaxID=1961369 RepID=UPI0031675C06
MRHREDYLFFLKYADILSFDSTRWSMVLTHFLAYYNPFKGKNYMVVHASELDANFKQITMLFDRFEKGELIPEQLYEELRKVATLRQLSTMRDLLDFLKDRPWEKCGCEYCSRLGAKMILSGFFDWRHSIAWGKHELLLGEPLYARALFDGDASLLPSLDFALVGYCVDESDRVYKKLMKISRGKLTTSMNVCGYSALIEAVSKSNVPVVVYVPREHPEVMLFIASSEKCYVVTKSKIAKRYGLEGKLVATTDLIARVRLAGAREKPAGGRRRTLFDYISH